MPILWGEATRRGLSFCPVGGRPVTISDSLLLWGRRAVGQEDEWGHRRMEQADAMSGKFDAAINCLSVMADRDFANGAPHRGQFRAAIRILEAAGKVDKNDAISTWYWLHSESAIMPPYVPDGSRQIRALLDALPDEVKHE